MKYLSLEEILYLHERIILESGGAQGIRDFPLLHSAIERPKASFAGKDLYGDVFSKAAAFAHSLILNHPFVDGNKRTAIASLIRFLEINRVKLKVNFQPLIKFALAVENKKMTLEETSSWLKKQSFLKPGAFPKR